MKRISCCLPVFALLALALPFANAQNAFDVNVGFGSFHDSASGGGLDNLNSVNALGACTPGSADTFCQATSGIGGFFLGFGGDLMFTPRYGAGFQATLNPTQSSYGPLQYRQIFYDFNGIYAPINQKKMVVQLLGGIGAARTSFSVNQSGCVGSAVLCSNTNQPIGSASHFDLHLGIGVQYFLTDHIFIRPQFDYHYVPGLTDQFGSTSVPGGSIWVGYNFGER